MACKHGAPGSKSAAALGLVAASALAGCASTAAPSAPAAPAVAACDPARDRAAIKKMAGEFSVEFEFEETEVLTAGYQPRDAYRTAASEVVEILEDSERAVVLQHVLLVEDEDGEPAAMKHWRQDWRFEDSALVEYRGKDTWDRTTLAAGDVACTWSQAVYEVTDAPRYESVGRWQHDGAVSTWTSRETWRPLPRREYTKRSDYDVLVGTNKHVVRDDGWSHDQDNVKLVLADGRRLVREKGDNTYERTTLEGAPMARAYLARTAPFWQAVRARWSELLAGPAPVTVTFKVEGKTLYEHLFPMADRTPLPAPADLAKEVAGVIGAYVQPAPARSASAAAPAR
jgi:hypothetical protein